MKTQQEYTFTRGHVSESLMKNTKRLWLKDGKPGTNELGNAERGKLMAEYIDRNRIGEILFHYSRMQSDEVKNVLLEVAKGVREIPAADVVERKTGEWIHNPGGESEFDAGDFYICDQCGSAEWQDSNFCPNCGADMRGDDDV